MIVDGSTSTPRSRIISVRSRYEIPYLQYQRRQTKMISTGNRRRLNMNHRTRHELSVPVNATEPRRELFQQAPRALLPLDNEISEPTQHPAAEVDAPGRRSGCTVAHGKVLTTVSLPPSGMRESAVPFIRYLPCSSLTDSPEAAEVLPCEEKEPADSRL